VSLKATTREHFDQVLSLPHERTPPVEPTAWYATDDNNVVAEVGYDPLTERWLGVVYGRSPDGWHEVDHGGDGYFDLDDDRKRSHTSSPE
jgi:hypothetical protein